MKHPTVKWGQDAFRLFVTVQFTMLDDPTLNQVSITDRSLAVKNGSYELEIELLHPVVSSTSKFMDKGTEIVITISKTCKMHWPRLSVSPVPNLSVDWSRWVNEDDEQFTSSKDPLTMEQLEEFASHFPTESLADTDVQQKLSAAIPFNEKDSSDLEAAPSLVSSTIDDADWLPFWLERMTTPQRMTTLVELWNKLDQRERIKLIKQLVNNVAAESPEASAHVKGGDSVLGELDPTHYKQEGVKHCQKWVTELNEMDSDTRMDFMNKMFTHLNDFDKKLVVTTFM